MDVVTTILKPVAELLMGPVKQQLDYFISCKKYMRDMGMKMRELSAKRLDVEEHVNRNIASRLEVPAHTRGWLEDVGKIDEEVKGVPSDVGGCFSLKMRHKLGRKAFKMIEEIDSATRTHSEFTWTDRPIPLGKVDSVKETIPVSATVHPEDLQSRQQTFTEALEALKPNKKTHMIALCGMGGVGKTTMMQKLKKVAEQTKMFEFIVEAVIGEKTDPIAIQEAVANYLGIQLNETVKPARAERLRKWFAANSDGGKMKFLIVLDDVWQFVDLNDIGLSPLPDQGVNFKVLLTSRDRQVCSDMGVEVDSILNVDLLTDAEAQCLFRQFSGTVDHELDKIGENIVKKCYGLPLAIKTMACTLKNRRKDAWKDALSRLEHHNVNNVVNEVFKLSYDNLQAEETKSIFLLCGLFPEDFNIPTECLVRYGWGLKLFKRVPNITEARARLNTCVEELIHKNLLMDSSIVGCVKMHDLALAFVLDMFTKVEHSSVVNHGGMLELPENSDSSCKKISLTCRGMSEFPRDLKFRSLSLLKLMHGDKSMRFPQDFYGEMESLQVISFDIMRCSLPPLSPQCSTNLRVLHIQICSLNVDCSSIGNLMNLEVLSFADSGIKCLPSTIGNLKKLRLLDLTGCSRLLRIDNGVLKKLVNLEEIYMRVSRYNQGDLRFTNDNCNEMAERSENLLALEFEFIDDNVPLKNMSFGKLQRFKISVGCYIGDDIGNTSENWLVLLTNKDKLVESKVNTLFEKTEELWLSVSGMNDLEDIDVNSSHPHQSFSFHNLRVLKVSKCSDMRYLFTLGVANTLSKLERLEVDECYNMEELIHTEGSGAETITFPKLKYLSLISLPRLLGLCHNDNIIELPQLQKLILNEIPTFTNIYPTNKLEASSLLKKEIMIPKLERLTITRMKDLKEIWPCEFGTSEEVNVSMLKFIRVENCFNLVNLFPCNPMPVIHHLEDLEEYKCDSIEVLFNIDLDCGGEIGEGNSDSSLRRIEMRGSGKLREVWSVKGADNSHLLVGGFQALEYINIEGCKSFRNIFTSVTKSLDLRALLEIKIGFCGENWSNDESAESSADQINIPSVEEETSKIRDGIYNVVLPSNLIHTSPNLRTLDLTSYGGVEVVFEIQSPTNRECVTTHDNQRLLPYLEVLNLESMERIHHIWKCNWNKFLILQKQPSESPFLNLTTINVYDCKSIRYVFSPLMANLLSNLKDVKIYNCGGLEEVVSNRDDEDEENASFTSRSTHTSTSLFPRLDYLTLSRLPNLKCIGGGGHANHVKNETAFSNSTTTTAFVDQFKFSEAGGVSWTLVQFAREIDIEHCHALSSVIPCYAVGKMQKIQVLSIKHCDLMKEVFETQGINSGCDEGNGGTPAIPRINNSVMLQVSNLRILKIEDCHLLEHISTFSALENLRQLEKLSIRRCKAMTVIMKEEDGEQMTAPKAVVFPRLKSIKLDNLPNLVGFFLGMNEFHWPSLDKVMINECPQIIVFTPGGSITPKLKYIYTGLGKHVLECGLNFHVTTTAHPHLQNLFPSLDGASSDLSTSERIPWSFHNLIKLVAESNESIKKIIPSNELVQLQKLEKVHVIECDRVKEVFGALEAGANSTGFHESQATIIELPNLRKVKVESSCRLRCIWKSNQWTVFMFPNLTRLYIDECDSLQHVFTGSMVGSLLKLQELHISDCPDMEAVFVKDSEVVLEEEDEAEDEMDEEEEEEEDCEINEITLPCLKSLKLVALSSFKGFCLRKKDFSLPLLNTLKIECCPKLKIFTKGNVVTPQLKEIEISDDSFYDVGEDINSFIKLKQEELQEE